MVTAGIVVDLLGVDRLHEGEPVRDLRRVRQQVADPCARLAALRERELRRHDREGRLRRRHAGQPLSVADRIGQLRALELHQPRLVVEQLDLRRAARLEQVDDALGLRREVRQAGQAALTRARPPRSSRQPTPDPVKKRLVIVTPS